jgi:hybrid cluster-associated redox disulfide protein
MYILDTAHRRPVKAVFVKGISVDTYRRDMLIRDVLTSHQGAAAVFERHNLGCPSCLAAEMETLSSVATMHDISVDVLIDDLNAMARQTEET